MSESTIEIVFGVISMVALFMVLMIVNNDDKEGS